MQTAPTQRRAAIAKMREGTESTSVMCFCDQVAPAFLYDEQELNNYYPENIIVATGFMDTDTVAHTYDHLFDPGPAGGRVPDVRERLRPRPGRPAGVAEHRLRGPHLEVGGQPGSPGLGRGRRLRLLELLRHPRDAGRAQPDARQHHGRAPSAPSPSCPSAAPTPGTGRGRVGANDFTWDDGLREIYFAPKRKSAYDGVSGAWGSLNGGRWFTGGKFPTGAIQLPGTAPRS